MNWLREIWDAISGLFKWWFIVEPWDKALRVRIGKHVTVWGQGIHFRVPFLDQVYIQNRRRRIQHLSEQTLSTRDGKCITVCGSVGYTIDDILKLYKTLHHADTTIQLHAMQFITDYIVHRPLADVSSEGLVAHVLERLDLKQYGLGNEEFFLTTFVVVKTYRFITEGSTQWGAGGLNTQTPAGSNQLPEGLM